MNLSVYREQNNTMSEIKKTVFVLQNTQLPNYEECNNYLGFNQIEIIKFNYDGEGNALVLEDEQIGYMSTETLRFVFFSGWYSLLKD